MKIVLAKGTVFMMLAQFVFLLSGYIIHIGLGRMLGPADYGIFGIIISCLTVFEIFLMKGLPQSISKFTAGSFEKAKAIFKKALKLQLIMASSLALLYFASANILAYFLKDPSLSYYIRLSALLIIPLTLFYMYVNGFLNGLRRFREQSLLLSLNAVLKMGLVFFFVWLGYRITGAITSYILAAVISLIIASFVLNLRKIKGISKIAVSNRQILVFAFPLIISSLSFTLLRNMDLLILKNILVENVKAGLYTASMTMSRVSTSLFVALSFTLLPSISKAVANKDIVLTKKYISESLRYLAILLFPMTFIISATSSNLISLFYSDKYILGAASLGILIFGSTFLATFSVLNTITIATGNLKIATLSAIAIIPLSAMLNYILIPIFELEGAALATTIATLSGTLFLSVYIIRKYNAFISPSSLIKILAASFLVFLITFYWQFSGIYLILTYLVSFALYFLILFLLKEFSKKDIKVLLGFAPFLKRFIPNKYKSPNKVKPFK